MQDPPRPNVLYRNEHNGTFRDVTGLAGVGGKGYGMGCTVGDYDNDGDDDLFVTGLRGTILYRNRGDGTFEDVTLSAGTFSDRWTTAAGFGDFDGDGDLDLVALAYADIDLNDLVECRDGSGRAIHCAPTRYPAQDDLLYRNNGDGTFSEISRTAGFVAPDGRGLGLAIADLDDDGKLDIFVANDASPNFLFHNRGGLRFEEIGVAAGVATNGSGRATASMGVVADDFDGDGRIDLFFTNLVNESSTLFRNLGGMLFVDATLGCGLDAPAGRRPVLGMLRSTRTTTGASICSWPTATSTIGLGLIAQWPRRHSSFGGATAVASTSPPLRLRRTSPVGSSGGVPRPATWTMTGESTWL